MAFSPDISGGIGFYVQNLVQALLRIDTTNQYFVFANLENHTLFVNSSNCQVIPLGTRPRPQWLRILYEQLYLPILARRLRLDLLHSPSYTWPLLCSVPGVVTICDMIYRTYPEAMAWSKRLFWGLCVPLSARRCSKILTISEYSKGEIVRYLGVKPDKVRVTLLAPDKRPDITHSDSVRRAGLEALKRRYEVRQPYLLTVGGVGRHKNAGVLVRALALLGQHPETREMGLMITGHSYEPAVLDDLRRLAAALDVGGRVWFSGYLEREELVFAYVGAAAYAAPSFYEGFGMTILEAMACGTPVITSDRASLPEIAGGAALIVDPDSAREIAAAVHRITVDPGLRDLLVQRGHENVEQFSWERTARATLAAYAEAVDDAHPSPPHR